MINNNTKKIILSPHYDDLPLSIGGLINTWKNHNFTIEDWIIFSLGNYLYSDKTGNKDFSSERVQSVSNKRYEEELSMSNDLEITTIRKIDCYEANFRGHNNLIATTQKKYTYNQKDQEALKKIKIILLPLLYQKVDLFIPLGFGGHYDHILLREAILELINKNVKASIFFYEDLPYIGNINWQQKIEMYFIIKKLKLKKIITPIDLKYKVNLLQHYPSQSDPIYIPSIIRHSKYLQKKYKSQQPMERYFQLTKTNIRHN